MAIIEAHHVYKRYKIGDQIITALEDINLDIHEGELTAIFGTSGCGKSTLLNLLSGLERPTKGEIIVQGKNLGKIRERDMARFRAREMGFIFQAYNLIGSLTALENVTLPLIIQGVSAKRRLDMGRAMLEKMGLKARLHNLPGQMSGGQQQRVSIARALITDPKIIFADEPTGNLDSKTTEEILIFLQDIIAQEGKTLIMVSHDIEVAHYADRIIHMKDGRVISEERMMRTIKNQQKEAGVQV